MREGRRKGFWIALIALVAVGPAVALSEFGLSRLQSVVNENAEKRWAADLQRYIAVAYAYTFRRDKAAEAYGWAARLYEFHNDHGQAVRCRYFQAVELEEANRKEEALAIYDELRASEPRHDVGVLSEAAATRLRHFSRP